MLVQFGGAEEPSLSRELLPGPFAAPEHGAWRKAYAAMAERAGQTLAHAVERRYDDLRKLRVEAIRQGGSDGQEARELRQELAEFGEGPPGSLEPGSPERRKWFQDWLDGHDVEQPMDFQSMSRGQMLSMLARDPRLMMMAQEQGLVPESAMRVVKVADKETLKPLMDAHPALKWDERLDKLCGKQGKVLQDDPSDGTSQVEFPAPQSATAWLPTSALSDVEGLRQGSHVRVKRDTDLRAAVEAHGALQWDDAMTKLVGAIGRILIADPDGTCKVTFPTGETGWFPNSVLEEVDASDRRAVVAPPLERLKSAMEAHPACQWRDQFEEVCGQRGVVLVQDDSDGTSQVKFPPPLDVSIWFPTDVLIPVDDAQAQTPSTSAGSPETHLEDDEEAEAEAEGGDEKPGKRQREEAAAAARTEAPVGEEQRKEEEPEAKQQRAAE